MKKATAVQLLGGSVTSAARAMRISTSAVTQWPDELPARLIDRVHAAIARQHLPPELLGEEASPEEQEGEVRDAA